MGAQWVRSCSKAAERYIAAWLIQTPTCCSNPVWCTTGKSKMTIEEKASKSKKTGGTGSNGMLLALVGMFFSMVTHHWEFWVVSDETEEEEAQSAPMHPPSPPITLDWGPDVKNPLLKVHIAVLCVTAACCWTDMLSLCV